MWKSTGVLLHFFNIKSHKTNKRLIFATPFHGKRSQFTDAPRFFAKSDLSLRKAIYFRRPPFSPSREGHAAIPAASGVDAKIELNSMVGQ